MRLEIYPPQTRDFGPLCLALGLPLKTSYDKSSLRPPPTSPAASLRSFRKDLHDPVSGTSREEI